jgi:hypothetical protein
VGSHYKYSSTYSPGVCNLEVGPKFLNSCGPLITTVPLNSVFQVVLNHFVVETHFTFRQQVDSYLPYWVPK